MPESDREGFERALPRKMSANLGQKHHLCKLSQAPVTASLPRVEFQRGLHNGDMVIKKAGTICLFRSNRLRGKKLKTDGKTGKKSVYIKKLEEK